jgi:hypothetical protein
MPNKSFKMNFADAKKRALKSRNFREWRRVRLPKGVLAETHKASDSLSRSLATEQHFTPAGLGKIWGLSAETIRALFENEPGILIVSTTEPGKRRYRTFRIPVSVAERVHRRMSP